MSSFNEMCFAKDQLGCPATFHLVLYVQKFQERRCTHFDSV